MLIFRDLKFQITGSHPISPGEISPWGPPYGLPPPFRPAVGVSVDPFVIPRSSRDLMFSVCSLDYLSASHLDARNVAAVSSTWQTDNDHSQEQTPEPEHLTLHRVEQTPAQHLLKAQTWKLASNIFFFLQLVNSVFAFNDFMIFCIFFCGSVIGNPVYSAHYGEHHSPPSLILKITDRVLLRWPNELELAKHAGACGAVGGLGVGRLSSVL